MLPFGCAVTSWNREKSGCVAGIGRQIALCGPGVRFNTFPPLYHGLCLMLRFEKVPALPLTKLRARVMTSGTELPVTSNHNVSPSDRSTKRPTPFAKPLIILASKNSVFSLEWSFCCGELSGHLFTGFAMVVMTYRTSSDGFQI